MKHHHQRKHHFLFALPGLLTLSFLIPPPANAQIKAKSVAQKNSKPSLTFSRYPSRFYSSRPFTPDPEILLRFSRPTSPAAAGKHFTFQEKAQKLSIPVEAKRPTEEQIQKIRRSTNRQYYGAIENYVLIKPASQLAIGEAWSLVAQAGLSSSDGSHVFHQNRIEYLGKLHPFTIFDVSPENPYDKEMSIQIEYSKSSLSPIFDEARLPEYVIVEPRPDDLTIKPHSYGMRLDAKFKYNTDYKVTIKAGLISNDRIQLNKQYDKTIRFRPNRGFVNLPLYSATQNAAGHREFQIKTANLKGVRTRIKSLAGDNLIFALKGYTDAYEGNGQERTVPYSLVPGKTIYDKTQETTADVDISETFTLSWNDISPGAEFGSYYVCSDGESDTRNGTTLGAQALVQLTDIGLAWKQSQSQTLVYAFSIKNGTPLSGVQLRLVSDEADEITRTKTDASGIARIAAKQYQKHKELWLDAAVGKDRHVMAFSKDLRSIGLWSFGIPYNPDGAVAGERRTLIFTDRDVYKPGEKVYIKAISRLVDNDKLLPTGQSPAKLTIRGSRGRKLVSEDINFGKTGSFDYELTLPESGLGYHAIEIDFNDPDNPEGREWKKVSSHSFQVAEYRPNTFEVSLQSKKDAFVGENITVPLSAKYYMGKPLSQAAASWNAYAYKRFLRPTGFEEFEFGDRYQKRSSHSENDTIHLNGKGNAEIEFSVPEDRDSPAPYSVSLRAEITDANQQTITERTRFTVHSSNFYIGLREPEGVFRVGDAVPFAIACVGADGSPHTDPVNTAITIQREIWNTVKVKGSDGKIVLRNDRQLDLKKHETFSVKTRVDQETGLTRAQTREIKFDEAGDYIITLESTDSEGRPVLTREKFRIIGAEEPAWAMHDVVRVDVIPDKKTYKIGETAKLLVRSPVFGKALLTTERGDVKTTRVLEIDQFETVIDVPVEKGAAPNIFASLLIVRGSAESPHKHPAADYRLGYCQLQVDDPASNLEVTLDSGDAEYFQPGQAVEVSALVSDSAGAPVTGAEVTFFAVDEGVLSLTGYETPDPGKIFHAPFPLTVMMGQSLSKLFPENPLEQNFGNKGYVIGGGGVADGAGIDLNKVRKDFKTIAFWKPKMETGPDGKVTHRFTAPDNLTSFRLMAIVAEGNRFAHAEKPVVVNKPLIIEPALPAFSNLSDQLDITAVLHNNTKAAQDLEIKVALDDHAIFLKKLGDPVPTNFPSPDETVRLRNRKMTILPGQTEVLSFPVAMTKTGEATWNWKVVSLTDPPLSDATESKLQVGYPLPLLRTSKTHTLRKAGDIDTLLKDVDPRLLSGRGDVEIEISNSRLIDATDAIDYLLTYPYGCVEQTTSTTIPWLSTQNLRKAIPGLNLSEKEVNAAITRGTNRLLSMQTRNGGLSYWPGGTEPVLWGSAYGGLALALAEKGGAKLNSDNLNNLWIYLSTQLRNSAKATGPYDLSQRCLAAYTLAIAGKAEPGYHEVLFEKRESLPREARALLALAIMESSPNTDAAQVARVKTLLNEKPGKANSGVRWYKKPYLTSTELMAWSRFKASDPKTDELLSELMKLRRPGSGWGSTYSNAWPLMALSAHSETATASLNENKATIQFDGKTETVTFSRGPLGKSFSFPFQGDKTKHPLKINLENDGPLYAHIKVATQPELLPMQPENKGFGIRRKYQEVDIEGKLSPPNDLMVGDLVLVTLDLNVAKEQEDYLAIDDPLPSILEAVNPNFKTQDTRGANQAANRREEHIRHLYANHREMRKDRTLFFADRIYRPGDYRIQYMARVVAPGRSIAPPAKIEAMYEPERFGLSGTETLSARKLDLGDGKVAMAVR